MSRTRKQQGDKFLDVYRQVRKPMPPPGRAINPKKAYDRRDKSWLETDDDDAGDEFKRDEESS